MRVSLFLDVPLQKGECIPPVRFASLASLVNISCLPFLPSSAGAFQVQHGPIDLQLKDRSEKDHLQKQVNLVMFESISPQHPMGRQAALGVTPKHVKGKANHSSSTLHPIDRVRSIAQGLYRRQNVKKSRHSTCPGLVFRAFHAGWVEDGLEAHSADALFTRTPPTRRVG